MNLGKTLKYAVAGLITAGILTVLFLCGQKASATAKERTCSGVEVEFSAMTVRISLPGMT